MNVYVLKFLVNKPLFRILFYLSKVISTRILEIGNMKFNSSEMSVAIGILLYCFKCQRPELSANNYVVQLLVTLNTKLGLR